MLSVLLTIFGIGSYLGEFSKQIHEMLFPQVY